MMTSEIDFERRRYAEAIIAVNTHPDWPHPIRIMSSSLVFGYLSLERDRWLAKQDITAITSVLLGISFAGVKKAVSDLIHPAA
jgi:hypothetical protein